MIPSGPKMLRMPWSSVHRQTEGRLRHYLAVVTPGTVLVATAMVYVGFTIVLAGLIGVVRPVRRLGMRQRSHAVIIVIAGLLIAAAGLLLPASESHIEKPESRLDEFAPVWQFNEVHTMRIAAPPERVYEAIKQVRAEEITFFRTLTWIRRGGKRLPENIASRAGEPQWTGYHQFDIARAGTMFCLQNWPCMVRSAM